MRPRSFCPLSPPSVPPPSLRSLSRFGAEFLRCRFVDVFAPVLGQFLLQAGTSDPQLASLSFSPLLVGTAALAAFLTSPELAVSLALWGVDVSPGLLSL